MLGSKSSINFVNLINKIFMHDHAAASYMSIAYKKFSYVLIFTLSMNKKAKWARDNFFNKPPNYHDNPNHCTTNYKTQHTYNP